MLARSATAASRCHVLWGLNRMPIALVIIVMPVLLVCYGIEKTETANTPAIGAEYSRRGGGLA